MKNKLKKWHIFLMSFVTLFVTILASLFSLRADTVDDETGEVLTDNWELGVVFYDSTVNNGRTALTEIDWNATTNSLDKGEPRVITVQINYKNDNAVTTYNAGSLQIQIPNLAYAASSKEGTASSAQWETTIMVGANDSTHSGFDWDFYSSYDYPSTYSEYFSFFNANNIEEKSNFEGSIQIIYTITPGKDSPERWVDECLHAYQKDIKATLYHITSEPIATSKNWPNSYTKYLTNYFCGEYTQEGAESLTLFFDKTSRLNGDAYAYIYDKDNNQIAKLNLWDLGNVRVEVPGDYAKITMTTGSSSVTKGFAIYASLLKIESNTISFNYERTYSHPWKYPTENLSKIPQKIKSLDGLPNANDYIWVKYHFEGFSGSSSSYPYIGIVNDSKYIYDDIPDECLVVSKLGIPFEKTDGIYKIPVSGNASTYSNTCMFYVGYPKSIYNDANGNLEITNTAQLYGNYENNPTVPVKLAEATCTFSLADFEFTYSGNLYGITKSGGTDYHYYQQFKLDPSTKWDLKASAVYTGTPLTIKIGDDLLYIKNEQEAIRKLNDEEYYISQITTVNQKNGNDINLEKGKYECELWVRLANSSDYILYDTFTNGNLGSKAELNFRNETTWNFTEEDNVCAYYIIIKDLNESYMPISYPTASGTVTLKENYVARNARIYNFCYLQVFTKDQNNNLVLQNEPALSSYSNLMTQLEIATFDQTTYGHYMQRSTYETYWSYHEITQPTLTIAAAKGTTGRITQDELNEVFTTTFSIGTQIVNSQRIEEVFYEQINDDRYITGFKIYDLLPAGMNLISTPEEILNSYYSSNYSTASHNSLLSTFLNLDKEVLNKAYMDELFKNNDSIKITENWNNTGRTKIEITIDIEHHPVYLVGDSFGTGGSNCFRVMYNINVSIPYDSYLEYGSVWTNRSYSSKFDRDIYAVNNGVYAYPTYPAEQVKDNGSINNLEIDMNENDIIDEFISVHSAAITIKAVVSTHQEVLKLVKTNLSEFAAKTVPSDCDSEYEYKLRIRTGQNDITNLIIYDNIETAQPERQRWQGEFLGIDTSYAENKYYRLYKPNDPNADSEGFISYKLKVKPYYSENPDAGDLYNENGSLNSDWKEYYDKTMPETYQNGLEIKFNSQCKTENATYDYVEIYYVLDGTTYKLGKWGGSELANKIIQVPSKDFYLYWHTDGSSCSYYGFSIDSISPIYMEDIESSSSRLPYYTPEEIQDKTYPDSAFDSYTHGNYGNRVDKVWHYTYTPEFKKIQDAVTGTDKTKVKSLAFEYIDENGDPAIVPSSHVTYVLIKMKSPADESITTLARNNCRTQWTAIDEFGQPVDFITGITSNVVKVALPNSVDEDSVPSITLKFIKEIQGTDSQFENMLLNKNNIQTFMIRLTDLTANEDGSHNQVTALLRSDQELIISQIPVGTYLLEELGDNYFDFINFTDNNDPEIVINGVTFEQTDQGYIIIVSEDLTENIEFNIKVTNEIEDERFYEHKDNKENLFLKNKIEESENPS